MESLKTFAKAHWRGIASLAVAALVIFVLPHFAAVGVLMGVGFVGTSNIPSTLKPVLNKVWGDQVKGTLDWMTLGFNVENSSDAYEDDQEFAHTGLMPAKAQGAMLALDTIQQGYSKRYLHVTYGLRMVVSEEALADCKYDEAIAGAKSIGRSAKLTQEFETASIFVNSFSSSYVGGDGVALCSASHPLPKGGTASNTLATPMSLSETAVETMWAAMSKLPGSNGIVQSGYDLKKIIIPKELHFRANRILRSEQQNDTNNNAINVLKDMKITIGEDRYFTSTTNWWGKSDLDTGLRFFWRQKPMSRQHNDEDNYTCTFTGLERFSCGWTDWRDVYGSSI
jgi:hypothetical protein